MKNLGKQMFPVLTLVAAAALIMTPAAFAQSSTQKSATSTATPAKAPAAPAVKNSAHAAGTVEYKDPEDMTTRYRPGNNKTTATDQGAGTSSGSSAAAHATAKQSGDKKQVTFPACDGASKDAAKCTATPPASGAQASKRANKVEAITVKQ